MALIISKTKIRMIITCSIASPPSIRGSADRSGALIDYIYIIN
jgi:hypothetical protein